MALLPIIEIPDPRLRTISAPVSAVTDDTRRLMDDMLETMYAAPGIGLAAIQVGVPQRLLVMDLQEEDKKNPRYFINPEILESSLELSTYNEGCLSVPDQEGQVDRPERVRVRWLDYTGTPREEWLEGLLATCLQHEMDHLNGVLFIDHLSKLKRSILLRKLEKMRKYADA